MTLDDAGKQGILNSYALVQKNVALKRDWLKLGVVERMILLILPSLVDDYGCMEYCPRVIRVRVFQETGMNLWRIVLAVRKLIKLGFIYIHKTNCGMSVLYAKFLVGMLPRTTNSKPILPLPPQIEWYNDIEGEYRIAHFD